MRAYDRSRKTKICNSFSSIYMFHSLLIIYFFLSLLSFSFSQNSCGRKYIWWLSILWFHNILFTYSHITYFRMFFRQICFTMDMQHMMLVELLPFYADNVLFETRDLMHLKTCQQVSQCSVSSGEFCTKSNTINGGRDRTKTKKESFWFQQLNPNELYPFTHLEIAHLT